MRTLSSSTANYYPRLLLEQSKFQNCIHFYVIRPGVSILSKATCNPFFHNFFRNCFNSYVWQDLTQFLDKLHLTSEWVLQGRRTIEIFITWTTCTRQRIGNYRRKKMSSPGGRQLFFFIGAFVFDRRDLFLLLLPIETFTFQTPASRFIRTSKKRVPVLLQHGKRPMWPSGKRWKQIRPIKSGLDLVQNLDSFSFILAVLFSWPRTKISLGIEFSIVYRVESS